MSRRFNSDKIHILLGSKNQNHLDLFEQLCKTKNYLVCNIVDNLADFEKALEKGDYHLVVCTPLFNEENVIDYLSENPTRVLKEVPVIFVLEEQLSTLQMKKFGSLMVHFLYEDYLALDFLDYSIQNALDHYSALKLMKENEIRYKALYEHSFDLNIIVDNKMCIVESNVVAKETLIPSINEALSKMFVYDATFNSLVHHLIVSGNIKNYDAKLIISNEISNCQVDAFSLFDENNRLLGYHLIIRDVDEDYKAKEKAKRANKLITTGKFMRSLAHEIRNPLTNIQLALEQLKEELNESDDSLTYYKIMKRSGSRIDTLLRTLINAYKSSEVVLIDTRIRDIIEQSVNLAKDRIVLKDVKLTIEYNNISNQIVKADLNKISTAILNLIVNAIEAMDKPTKKVGISAFLDKNGQIKITIADNGTGMDKETLEALFDPFYTGKSKGIGLGLTTAQNVIFAHNWHLNVESTLGKGTLFTITTNIL